MIAKSGLLPCGPWLSHVKSGFRQELTVWHCLAGGSCRKVEDAPCSRRVDCLEHGCADVHGCGVLGHYQLKRASQRESDSCACPAAEPVVIPPGELASCLHPLVERGSS